MINLTEEKLNLKTTLDAPLVTILLCTYNGERYLTEQLDSLERQSYANWVVIASDDGSTDKTLEILRKYQLKWSIGKLIIRSGPQKSFCKNFLSLACDKGIKGEYFAYCDQDDIWANNKLLNIIEYISKNEVENIPYLYCGRSIYIDKNSKRIGISPKFIQKPSFRNALVQSIAGGNTMLFNKSTKLILEKIGIVEVPSHDWWTYIQVSGVGGIVYFDTLPLIYYRQHDNCVIGANNSIYAKIIRLNMVFKNQFKNWNNLNINSLSKNDYLLHSENKFILDLFIEMRNANLFKRIKLFKKTGLYRQTSFGTLSLLIALIFKKI